MNILVIPDRLEIKGGLETHVVSLAKKWNTKKNNVLVYSNAISAEYKKELSGCDLISGWTLEKDEYIIKNFKPDVIVSHVFSGIGVGHRIKQKIQEVKLFAVVHGRNANGLTKEYLNDIEKVFVVSDLAKKAIESFVPESKIELIYNGINTKDFFATRKSPVHIKKFGLNSKFKTISAITRLENGKEIPLKQLIKIAPELARRVDGLNIVICGDGHFKDEIKGQVDKIKDNSLIIKMVGEVDNVRTFINLADLVLGCDRLAIESLLCKKNVFYMGQSKWGSLIKNDEFEDILFTEKYLTKYTDEELINHLCWMLTQEEHLKQFTDKLYDIAIEKCSLDVVAKKYLESFDNALSKKKELN